MFGTGQLAAQIRETRDIAVRADTKTDSHVLACMEHNKRVEDMLNATTVLREKQHNENQEAIARVYERMNSLSGRMTMMVIAALGTTVVALIGALYAIFAHKMGLTG